jgi:hypothetical protein
MACVVPEWERALVVDPFVIDKFLHRFRKGSRKLADGLRALRREAGRGARGWR